MLLDLRSLWELIVPPQPGVAAIARISATVRTEAAVSVSARTTAAVSADARTVATVSVARRTEP